MTTYEVTLTVTQELRYTVEDADNVGQATDRAAQSFWDGYHGGDPGMPALETTGVKVGDLGVDVSHHLDWGGPKDERGLTGWKTVVYGGSPRRQLAEGRDTAEVVQRALDALATEVPA